MFDFPLGAWFVDNKTLDSVRIEPIFVGSGGDAYWKLKCDGKSGLLHQSK